MADGGQPGASFDEIIQEGRRKRAAEKLAQEIFGKKGGRSSAPPSGPKAGLGGSLASRVGVTKRNSPSPRTNVPRQPRQQLNTRPAAEDNHRPRLAHTQSSAPDLGSYPKRNGDARDEVANGGGVELSIKGAASGPYIVIAQNFAPGTTAADIESVMLSVGGTMNSCKLVASNPTVIAEMSFVERVGAEKVIETFNGKKADGRPLYVYWKTGGGLTPKQTTTMAGARQPDLINAPISDEVDEVVMEVDENAESREAQNRLREERRGRDDRPPRDVFPTGPRGYQAEMDRYDNRPPRRPEPGYQDGRYGFGGRGGYRDGPPRGRYPRDDRRYGGQSWRP